jgi:hypothetical protein
MTTLKNHKIMVNIVCSCLVLLGLYGNAERFDPLLENSSHNELQDLQAGGLGGLPCGNIKR